MKEIDQLTEKFKKGFPEYKCFNCYLEAYKINTLKKKSKFSPKAIISKFMDKII